VSTEAELVLMSLTAEELADAVRWLELIHSQWETHIAATVDGDGPPTNAQAFGHGTDGPMHLIRAMDLAIIRERAQRGGAEPWYAGMPIEDHPARAYLSYYQQRIVLNPDEGHKPRLSAAGIVEKVCPGCSEAKPLTVAFWGWLGHGLDDYCRSCRNPISASDQAIAVRQALIEAEDAAASAPPAPVETFETADVDEAEDALAML
jgi:hypothetical protein